MQRFSHKDVNCSFLFNSIKAGKSVSQDLESKRRMVEVKLTEVCQMARSIGIHADDLHSILDLILEEENEK